MGKSPRSAVAGFAAGIGVSVIIAFVFFILIPKLSPSTPSQPAVLSLVGQSGKAQPEQMFSASPATGDMKTNRSGLAGKGRDQDHLAMLITGKVCGAAKTAAVLVLAQSLSRARRARARALREEGESLRDIADALAFEFGLKKLDAKSLKRVLDRN